MVSDTWLKDEMRTPYFRTPAALLYRQSQSLCTSTACDWIEYKRTHVSKPYLSFPSFSPSPLKAC
jgi:hypothetical protein